MNFCYFLLIVSPIYAIDFDCLRGPTYWCASLENAKKCGRTIECSVTEMNTINDGVVSMSRSNKGDYCKTCVQLVTELEKVLLANLTEKQFVDYIVNNVCSKLSSDTIVLCKSLVNEYGSIMFNQLTMLIKPDNVCSYLHLCNNMTIPSMGSPATCKACKQALAFLESLLKSVTPDQLKFLLKMAICNQLPPGVRSMCNMLVDGYTGHIYQLLLSLLDGNRVCPALHLCSTPTSEVSFSWSCQTCIDVIDALKKDLANVSTVDVEYLLKTKICSKFPFIAKGFCDRNIDENVPQFLNDIKSDMSAQQICAKHTVCSSTSIDSDNAVTSTIGTIECDSCELAMGELKKFLLTKDGEILIKNYIKTTICKYLGKESQKCVDFVDKYGDDLMYFINTKMSNRKICELFGACTVGYRLPRTSTKTTGIECEACHLLLEKFKGYISDPANQAKIKSYLKNIVCQIFKSKKTECENAVDQYFNIIFSAVISEMNVDQICKLLKYCPQSVGTAKCDTCELMMKGVILFITSDTFKERFVEIITIDVCPKLDLLKSECVTVAATYIPYLLKIARESPDSKMLCSRLNLCSLVSLKKIGSLIKSMKVKSYKCDLCQFAINETIALLSDTEIQKKIETFLKEEICPCFDSKEEECVKTIDTYYYIILNLALQSLNPSICSTLRLCNSRPMLNLQRALTISSKDVDLTDCEMCKKLYRFIATINDKMSIDDIILGLVGVCSGYYGEDKTKCLGQMKGVHSLMASFKSSKSEGDFCERSAMCRDKSQTTTFVQKHCVWGPGYWCISRKHAELCGIGATRHCELKVWKENPID